jgi:hypothetical protein
MFKIKLKILAMYINIVFPSPPTLYIRKDHWHYKLISNITEPIIEQIHSI